MGIANHESVAMDPNSRFTLHFYKWFAKFPRFLGIDLTNSLFSFKRSRTEGKIPIAIVMTLIFLLTLTNSTVNAFRFLGMKHFAALESDWAFRNLNLGYFLIGFMSIVSIGIWTHSRFMLTLEKKLSSIQEKDEKKFEKSLNSVRRRVTVFSVLFVLLSVGHAYADVTMNAIQGIPDLKNNGTSPVMSEHTSALSMYISKWEIPIARITSVILSCIAVSIYVLSNSSISSHVDQLNEDIRAVAESGDLQNPSALSKLSDRQIEILEIVRYSNGHCDKLATLAVVGCGTLHVNAAFLAMIHVSWLHYPTMVVCIGTAVFSLLFYFLITLIPANLNNRNLKTASILKNEKSIWNSEDKQLHWVASGMISRAEASDHKLLFLQAIPINIVFVHVISISFFFWLQFFVYNYKY